MKDEDEIVVDKKTLNKNKLFCPSLMALITQSYMTYLPLWGSLLTKLYGFDGRYSNTNVENYIWKVKNIYLSETNLKVGRFVNIMKKVKYDTLEFCKTSKIIIRPTCGTKQKASSKSSPSKKKSKLFTSSPSSSIASSVGSQNSINHDPNDPNALEEWNKKRKPKSSHFAGRHIRKILTPVYIILTSRAINQKKKKNAVRSWR